jgi:Cu/Ag efflux protein CusF
MKRALAVAVGLAVLSFSAYAQKPVTKSASITHKAKIEAIDHDDRTITLKDKDGKLEVLHAGPEIKRFDELKVGDEVTFKYTESVAVRLRKPGDPVVASSSGEPAIVRGTGAKPSGSITQQETATVLIKAVDTKTPAVTVQSEDGRTMSLKVEDKGLLKDVKVGDKMEVTYTIALLIDVK